MLSRKASRNSASGSGASYSVAEGHASSPDTSTNTNRNASTARTSNSSSRAHAPPMPTSPPPSNTNANTNSPKHPNLIRSPSKPVLRPPSPCPYSNNASRIPKPRLDQPHGATAALDASGHGSGSSHANASSKSRSGSSRGTGNAVRHPHGPSPSPSRSPSPSPSSSTPRKNPASAYGGLLYPSSGSPSSPSTSSSPSSATASASANPRPRVPSRSSSPSPSRSPSLSRTQLRHASAVRRLSSDGPGLGLGVLNENILPHNHNSNQQGNKPHATSANLVSSPSSSPGTKVKAKAKAVSTSTSELLKKRDESFWNGIQNRLANNLKGSSSFSIGKREGQFPGHHALHGLKRKEIDAAPDIPGLSMNANTGTNTTLPPYLVKTLEVAGVGLMADSASMETLMDNREILGATFLTPQSVLDKMNVSDTYYHLWVAVRLALEEMPVKEHATDEVVKLAFTKLLIELGSALNECLKPDLPHYTFVDIRKIMLPGGWASIIEQAIAIVEGLEKKGIAKERVYVSIPASETGLAIAKKLKEEHGIKTNLVFVSGPTRAAACAAVGADAITLSFDNILTYHELRRGGNYSDMNPHPGRQNIKATACFVKHHKLEMKLIASGLRWLEEIEHCSAVDMVCLNDNQVKPVRWARMRVNRPPGPTSYIMSLAKAVPYPPKLTSSSPSSSTSPSSADKQRSESYKYYSEVSSPEERDEIAGILHAGMRRWEEATAKLEDLIIREMEKQMGLWAVDALEGETDLEDVDGDVDMDMDRDRVEDAGRGREREQEEWARFERELKAQGALNPREAVLAVLEKLGKEKRNPRSSANGSGFDEPLRGRSQSQRWDQGQVRAQTQRQIQYSRDRCRSTSGSRQAVGDLGIEFPRKTSSLPSTSASASTSSPRYRKAFDPYSYTDEEELAIHDSRSESECPSEIDGNVLGYERGESSEPLGNVSVTGASSVPPSPYWTDAESFEDVGSSSDEEVDPSGDVEVDLGEEVDENQEVGINIVGDASDAMVLF